MSVNTYACLRCGQRALPQAQQEQCIHLIHQKWRQATSGRALNLGFHQIGLSLTRSHINSPLASWGTTDFSGVVCSIREQHFFFLLIMHFIIQLQLEAILYSWPLSSSQTIGEYCSDPRARCLFRSSRKFRKSCLTNTSVKVTDQPEH